MRDNGGLDPAKMIRRHREFSLRGDYRKVVVRFLAEPGFEVRAYEDDNEQMHPTDMDRIRAARGGAGKKRGREDGEEANGENKKAKAEAAPETEAQEDGANGDDEKMEDAPQTEDKPAAEAEAKTEDAAAEANPAAEKTKTAVVVRFQLPKSAYATVALRELMGVDESEVAAVPAASAVTETAEATKPSSSEPVAAEA
ncbi:tRNA pseudouridine synthase D [Colletotrichum tofieldiae]|nr:tRNA pseudouridine synthase D [Colletotrichum tofieldiae]